MRLLIEEDDKKAEIFDNVYTYERYNIADMANRLRRLLLAFGFLSDSVDKIINSSYKEDK
jgi:hypothetical protein